MADDSHETNGIVRVGVAVAAPADIAVAVAVAVVDIVADLAAVAWRVGVLRYIEFLHSQLVAVL